MHILCATNFIFKRVFHNNAIIMVNVMIVMNHVSFFDISVCITFVLVLQMID